MCSGPFFSAICSRWVSYSNGADSKPVMWATKPLMVVCPSWGSIDMEPLTTAISAVFLWACMSGPFSKSVLFVLCGCLVVYVHYIATDESNRQTRNIICEDMGGTVVAQNLILLILQKKEWKIQGLCS